MASTEHLLSEFWYLPGEGAHRNSPNNYLDTESLVSFWVDISHTLSQLTDGGVRGSCVNPLREDFRAYTWSPQASSTVPFPCECFTLSLSIEINHSRDYSYTQIPMSPPTTLKLGVSWGP